MFDRIAALGVEVQLWLTMIFGAVVKIALSESQPSPWKTIGSFLIAVFSAWVMTEPTLRWLDLDRDSYVYVVAAVWTLMGESVARAVMRVGPELVTAFIQNWGKK